MMTKNKQNNSSKKFRLRGLKFFLTYPQLPERDDLQSSALAQFENIFKMSSADFQYVMSVERHEDGNPHLHVYLEFNEPQGVYSAGKLDLAFDDVTYHGNYQVVKSEHATLRYILKSTGESGGPFSNKDLPIYDGNYHSNIHDHLYSVLTAEGYYDAIKVLYTVYPKQAMKNGSSIVRNLQMMHDYYEMRKDVDRIPRFTLNDFRNLPHDVKVWLDSKKPMTVLIWGPSGVGKTELAKAVLYAKGKRVLFVREIQALKDFEPGFHDAIIFDDLNVSETPREELIHLVDIDNASDVRLLYRGKRLPADIDRVFTTNTLSYFTRDEAVRRRLHFINISHSIILISSTPSSVSDDNTSPDADAARVGSIEAIRGDNTLPDADAARVGSIEAIGNNPLSESFPSELFSPPSKQTEPAGIYVRNPEFTRQLADPVLLRLFQDDSSTSAFPTQFHPPSSPTSAETQPHSSFVPAVITSPVVPNSVETQSTADPASPDSTRDQISPPAPKKRGRPKGSKNKRKR